MVADKVVVTSKHDEGDQYIWTSHANGEYDVVQDPRGNTLGRGTKITLHLKEDAAEYLKEAELEKVVHRYSEFVRHPIFLRVCFIHLLFKI